MIPLFLQQDFLFHLYIDQEIDHPQNPTQNQTEQE